MVHPDLLGTYGDGGNASVLAQRLRWRGFPAEVIEAHSANPVPASADLYCLGGGEDGPEAESAALLSASRSLHRAVDSGAAVLAVCAGFQVVGRDFAGADGRPRRGLDLLDVSAVKGEGRRAVGEVVVDPEARLGLPALTGYENHGSVTILGPSVRPLGTVRAGVGNGGGDGKEGAVGERVLGTYLHGPVLARNPALADLVLSWVVGSVLPIGEGGVEDEVAMLRFERLGAGRALRPAWRTTRSRRAGRSGPGGLWGALRAGSPRRGALRPAGRG